MRLAILLTLFLCQTITASKYIRSSSLLTCMENSGFTASYFDVYFYPDNSTVVFDITAISTINTYVGANINLIVYGINALSKNFTLCSLNYDTVCPLSSTRLELSSHYTVSDSITKQIPGIAYTIPDLDARVQVILYDANSTDFTTLACVEAVLTNGKTVQTKYAAWPIAAISGLGLLTSGFISTIGHSNTAAHIASNSMSLFIYFQSLAITSMMAVSRVPPIAAAWAQNFQWSLGIIRLHTIQAIANWYVQATGGTPTDIVGSSYLSISVQKLIKRSETVSNLIDYIKPQEPDVVSTYLSKRSNDDFTYEYNLNSTLYTTNEKDSSISSKILILRGIQRVAYLAGIEITDIFMTGLIFFLFFMFILVVVLMFFKAIVEILIRAKMMNEGKFAEYRQQWGTIIKGALYRLTLVAFPQLGVLCFWELYARDSAGCIVVAVFMIAIVIILLVSAAVRVVLLGRESTTMYKNPAYLLYGDSKFLNRFGFIYVQFRADAYYFVGVGLLYTLLRVLFVALMQEYGSVQSILVFVVEFIYFVLLCWLRPYMDKRTNAFNIAISSVSTLNSIFYMFFSNVFGQPHVVSSVMAVVLFVLNAIFALFLLIFTIVTCVLAMIYKNPDTRYQPMKDDRVSFIPRFENKNPKLSSNVNNNDDLELMALGATAMRGHEQVDSNEFDSSDENLPQKITPYDHLKNSESTTFDMNSRKRDSIASDINDIEPTQPNSTITGNSNTVYNRNNQNNDSAGLFNTSYNGFDASKKNLRWG